jgi:hypothetical protein
MGVTFGCRGSPPGGFYIRAEGYWQVGIPIRQRQVPSNRLRRCGVTLYSSTEWFDHAKHVAHEYAAR